MLTPDELVSLIWTLPPGAPGGMTTSQQDYDNLRASRVKRLEIVGEFATVALLREVRNSTQVRRFAARLHDYDYDTPEARARWHDRLGALKAEGLDTAVLGVEVNDRFDMRFESKNWGEDRAKQIRDAVLELVEEWASLGIKISAPALKYQGQYRDWREGLMPGLFRWREILREAANKCHYSTEHVYGADGTWYDTDKRVRVGLWLALSLANTNVWLGETNIDRGTDQEQALFLVRLLSLLYWSDPRHPDFGPWAGSGERLVQFVPFAANGDTRGWGSPNHLIADIEAYRTIGRFMGGERFYFPL